MHSTTNPGPIPNGNPAIWDLVIADMKARDAAGIATYKVRLQANNGRDALQDAYEEALDLAAYLKQAIEERRTKTGSWEPKSIHQLIAEQCVEPVTDGSQLVGIWLK